MLTDHQSSPVTSILGQFHKRYLNHQSLKSVWKYISFKFPRGQWVNPWIQLLQFDSRSLRVVSLTFHELSKIVSRNLCTAEIVFLMRISSWNFVAFSWNSHRKCDFWHCVFSRDYFGELVKQPPGTHWPIATVRDNSPAMGNDVIQWQRPCSVKALDRQKTQGPTSQRVYGSIILF